MSAFADELLADESSDLQSIPFHYWDTKKKKCVIYRRPRTLADARRVSVRSKGDNNAAVVWSIILEALDKDGNKLFDLGDKDKLLKSGARKFHPQVLIELSEKLCSYNGVEELKKP